MTEHAMKSVSHCRLCGVEGSFSDLCCIENTSRLAPRAPLHLRVCVDCYKDWQRYANSVTRRNRKVQKAMK